MFRSQPRALRDLGGERVPTSSQLCGTFQLTGVTSQSGQSGCVNPLK